MIQQNTESHTNPHLSGDKQQSPPVLDLSPRDQQNIAEALFNPPAPNKALKKAARN
ncbi:MAG: DUF1778 domain-containing protein [Xenococcus sp. MO_188.B8]|nr:DUF1778 domain-containing protein [Xenococcus sp. MO_188.B8]